MIYEFIATITAAFGMAGIALIIRHLSKMAGRPAPKWLLPLFAAIGILGFQIHQEYNWHKQQINLLPDTMTVVKTVKDKSWYRPWSYINPQVIRFMAIDEGQDISTKIDSTNINSAHNSDTIKQVNVYLFERRISTKVIPQLINCTHPATADLGPTPIQSESDLNSLTWHPIDINNELIQTVCS